MSIKSAKKKKRQQQAQQKEAEKIAKNLQDTEDMYKRMFDSVTISQIEANQKQRYNDMMSNLSYNTGSDDSVYRQQQSIPEVEVVDMPQVEDFTTGDVKPKHFEYSDDADLNDFFDRKLNDGLTYEEINTTINQGRRTKKLSEEQYNMAKKYLEMNEDFIRSTNPQKVVVQETTEQVVKGVSGEVAEEVAEEAVNVGNPYFKQVFSGRNLGAVLNLGFAISDYNEARNAGDGVVKSAAKAGAQFVAGEMLGAWMFPVMLAKQVPSIAVNTIEATQQMTRQMNSTSRIQTFGEAQFRDTQQLATMRQAGMEMAKMSQYNLQQSIMGNEAQYMHRL